MGLFKKENCIICEKEVGLLDKKCADGKVCKECTKKLSVYFDDYKNATKGDLINQMASKVLEDTELLNYNFNKIYGEMGVILIDEENKVFAALPTTSTKLFGEERNVKSIKDIYDLHPDLIRFNQVKDFEIDITETSKEEKYEENGEKKSYSPQRFIYMESFTLRIILDHPFLKSIYIPLDKAAVQIKNEGRRLWTDPGRKLAAHLLGLPTLIKEDQEVYFDNESLLHFLLRSKYEMPEYSYGFKCTISNWDDIKKYQYYLYMCKEIKEIILGENNG